MSAENLLALLQRPFEPTFYPKDNGKTIIDLPENFLTERYRMIGQEIQTRFGLDANTRIPVRSITAPNIAFAEVIDRRGAFSIFIPQHRRISGQLIEFFLKQPDVNTLMAVAAYARDRLNPVLFQYALAVAIQHRQDTKNINIPSVVQLFPDQFVDPAVFPKAREEGTIVQQANRMIIEIPQNYTASDREEEQRVAYWREDIGVNVHHWHWHLVYPGEAGSMNNAEALRVINKDRRGELFYFMHGQIVARYNLERFSNRLNRVRPYGNLREPIAEAYFPKLIRSSNMRSYPGRVANQVVRDVNRPDNNTVVTVSDMELWHGRILEAIDQGFVNDQQNNRISLDNDRGIDTLGNVIENSLLSPNIPYYGNYHSMGHLIFAYIHDPDNRFLEDFGVMGDFTTAMRDPIFYRWHQYLDDVFNRHKERLTPYNAQELGFDGILITNVQAQLNRTKVPPNLLLTYWQRSQVDLASGLDFGPDGNVFASFTHIQHAPFAWRVEVNNASGVARRGTCRIYLAPKFDERGQQFAYREQRRFAIEMDKFSVILNPGTNTIVRRADQSSVTIPYERTFRQLGRQNTPTEAGALAQFRFCGCGWPQHMLIPKGTPEGMVFELFVMISNFNDDTVNQEFDENVDCNDAYSFCGLKDRLYPDKRPMGFPFDRRATASNLSSFVSPYSNMRTADITIRFNNTIIART